MRSFQFSSFRWNAVDKPIGGTDGDLNSSEGSEIDLDQTVKGDTATDKPASGIDRNSHTPTGNEVFIMDNRGEDRTASFFAQPGILAGEYEFTACFIWVEWDNYETDVFYMFFFIYTSKDCWFLSF